MNEKRLKMQIKTDEKHDKCADDDDEPLPRTPIPNP